MDGAGDFWAFLWFEDFVQGVAEAFAYDESFKDHYSSEFFQGRFTAEIWKAEDKDLCLSDGFIQCGAGFV